MPKGSNIKEGIAIAIMAMGLSVAASSAMAQAKPQAKPASKASGPEVVVHPLPQEERLQEADYQDFEPLMEGMGPYSVVDPDKVEARAKDLLERGSKTDSPFVDWAHAAALSLSSLDPTSEADRDRSSRWGAYWTLLSRPARSRFEANQAGRAESIADNALCAYRPDESSKRDCVQASRERSKLASSALGMDWARWVEQAAAGLAQSAGWPSKWAQSKARIQKEAGGEAKAAELEGKLVRLDRWALLLNPPEPKIPVDALALARNWAKESCWSAAKPAAGAFCESKPRSAKSK